MEVSSSDKVQHASAVAIYSMIDTELTLNDLRTQIEDRGCLCAL